MQTMMPSGFLFPQSKFMKATFADKHLWDLESVSDLVISVGYTRLTTADTGSGIRRAHHGGLFA
jgi:hypothetical protein